MKLALGIGPGKFLFKNENEKNELDAVPLI